MSEPLWSVSTQRPESGRKTKDSEFTAALVSTLGGGSLRLEMDRASFNRIVMSRGTQMKRRGLQLRSRWRESESAGYIWVERREVEEAS